MKILELEINNVRGIKSLLLTPQGKTFVVWGPNGTGKSGVIDSIDFLLTGKVTRLTGPGTKDLTLLKHGPHIDNSVEEAFVRAKVQLHGVSESIEIRREMSEPNTLIYDSQYKEKLDFVLEFAGRGQHVLTRREILQYITAESGTRAEKIQILLNINEIEKTRKNFGKLSGNATRAAQVYSNALGQAKAGVNSTTGKRDYREAEILEIIRLVGV